MGDVTVQTDSIVLSEEEEKLATSLYKHTKELSQLKYDSELRREDSLIQQSSNMQTAFSFMTAAIFMALPILIEYRGILSIMFFVVSTSSIVISLLGSLLFASIAQRRVKKHTLMNVFDIEKFVSDNSETSTKEVQQIKQWVHLIGTVQKSLAETNEKRVKWIRFSMTSFFISILLILFWYVIAICKYL